MNLRRVTALAVLGLGLGVTVARAQPTEDEVHLLGRLGYGHDRWSLNRLRALGEQGYIDEQLDPASISDPELNQILRTDPAFDGLRMNLPQLFQTFGNKDGQRPIGELTNQLQRELLLRAILSRRQLEAVLVEFWFNHFNVDGTGSEVNYLVPYVRDTLRPRVLGKFEDLLLAVARSPAMLTYLDNAYNFRDGYVRGGKTLGINENYARELLELHTLGIDDQGKPYDQKDVIEAARALTGWTNRREGDGFEFVAAGHDDGPKKIMGLALRAGGGERDGIELIKYLANHPRTKRFITRKLVRFFVGEVPQALVDRAVQRWDATGGNLKAVVRTILVSPELRAAKGAKVRRPTMLLASALRAVDVDLSDPAERATVLARLDQHCTKLGQNLHNFEAPTGWDDTNKTFVSEGSMIRRFNAFHALCVSGSRFASDFDPRNKNDAALVTALTDRILGKGVVSATTRAAIEDYLGSLSPTVDPTVRARTAMALVFSSPEFGTY